MKKGFTLIELLAVIVILAIIAIIAVPIVLNIIEDTKKSTILRSADFYLDGVRNSIASAILKNIEIKDGTYSIMPDGNMCIGTFEGNTCSGDILKVEMDGDVPTSGTITITQGEIERMDLIISNKNLWTNPESGKIEIIDEEIISPEVVLDPGLYDENNILLASWDELNAKTLEMTEGDIDFETFIKIGDDYGYESLASDVIDSIDGSYRLVITEDVTEIGESAFENCVNLSKITLPSTLKSIGEFAFAWCDNLKEIIIPSNVTVISNLAFAHCTNLKTVNILGNITTIGMEAFLGCESLTSITLPESLKNIGDGAFAGTGLTSIIIPKGITDVGNYAFASSELRSIPIINGSLGYNVFESCDNLVEITVPANIIESDGAFADCKNLKKVIIEEGTTSIPSNAFFGCTNLTEVVIPDTVTQIGYFEGGEYGRDYYSGPFESCTALKKIYFKGYAEGEPWGAPTETEIIKDF